MADDITTPLCATLDPFTRGSSVGSNATVMNGTRWDLGKPIRIKFLETMKNVTDLIELHTKEWSDLTKMAFTFVKPDDRQASDVRIAFSAALGVNPGEFSSAVGTQARSMNQFLPTMKLGFTSGFAADLLEPKEVKRLILHEFGHMLGMVHEHQNPNSNIVFNRNALIQEMSRFGFTPAMVEQNIISRFDPSQVTATPFDESSIMMYALDARFANPPTHVNFEISAKDKELIQRIYEAGAAVGPIAGAQVQAAGIPLEIGTPSEEEFYVPVNSFLFHFEVSAKKTYVMRTDSARPWTMTLLGPEASNQLIAVDDKNSGIGPNALIERKLSPGTYFLKIDAQIRDRPGQSLRVIVEPA